MLQPGRSIHSLTLNKPTRSPLSALHASGYETILLLPLEGGTTGQNPLCVLPRPPHLSLLKPPPHPRTTSTRAIPQGRPRPQILSHSAAPDLAATHPSLETSWPWGPRGRSAPLTGNSLPPVCQSLCVGHEGSGLRTLPSLLTPPSPQSAHGPDSSPCSASTSMHRRTEHQHRTRLQPGLSLGAFWLSHRSPVHPDPEAPRKSLQRGTSHHHSKWLLYPSPSAPCTLRRKSIILSAARGGAAGPCPAFSLHQHRSTPALTPPRSLAQVHVPRDHQSPRAALSFTLLPALTALAPSSLLYEHCWSGCV